MSRTVFSLLAAVVTLGGLAVVVWAARFGSRLFARRARHAAFTSILLYGATLILRPSSWLVGDLAVLLGAAGGVQLIEGGLKTPGAVAAFLSVAAVVDVISMSGGLSRMLVEAYRQGTSDFLLYLTLTVPIRGQVVPIVGIGDLLVGGAAAVALLRLGFGRAPVMGAMAAGLMAALAYGLWRGGAPAVPFIAVAVIALVWRRSARSRADRR
jgi:hypothetical protein